MFAGLKKKAWPVANHCILILSCMVMLYPFIIIFFTAFKENSEVYTNPVGFPQKWVLTNFTGAWAEAHLGRLYINSIIITVSCVFVSLFVCSLASYAITRSAAKYSGKVYLFFISGIFIPSQLSIIPLFKMVKDLHLNNSYAGVIMVYIAGAIPLGIFMITTFMRGLPKEMSEAAAIDGCGYFYMYWKIYMPLMGTVAATFGILQALAAWNDFLIPYLLLTDETKRTLTTGVMTFKQQYSSNWGFLMAGIMMMVIPIITAYLFLQKYIMKGLTAGAVKG
jgi:raffinose/stachyose/melibiose transport system permease protein